MGFSGSSAGQKSACNAGDPGSFPRLGRSFGEGIGYPLKCFLLVYDRDVYLKNNCFEEMMFVCVPLTKAI